MDEILTFCGAGLRLAQWVAGEGSDFSSNTDEAIVIGSVGGYLQIENRVFLAAAKIASHGRAWLGTRIEDHQAIMVLRKPKLGPRAHHAT